MRLTSKRFSPIKKGKGWQPDGQWGTGLKAFPTTSLLKTIVPISEQPLLNHYSTINLEFSIIGIPSPVLNPTPVSPRSSTKVTFASHGSQEDKTKPQTHVSRFLHSLCHISQHVPRWQDIPSHLKNVNRSQCLWFRPFETWTFCRYKLWRHGGTCVLKDISIKFISFRLFVLSSNIVLFPIAFLLSIYPAYRRNYPPGYNSELLLHLVAAYTA